MRPEERQRLFGRDFWLLWQGQLVSQLGNQAFLIATMWWALEAVGSTALMGALLMASTLPAVVFGPVAGAMADRHSRQGLIIVSDLARGVGHLGLAMTFSATPDATSVIAPLLVTWASLSGVLGTLLTPALTAAIPDLVPARRLAAANSLHQMSAQAAALVGQSAGGLAYVWIGAPGLVLFDGITFIFSAGCAALARLPPPSPRPRATLQDHVRTYWSDTREAIAWLACHPPLRSLIVVFAGVNLLFTPVFVLLPVYVKDCLARGPEWYGFLLAAAGGGAMAGAAAAPLAVKAGLALRSHLFGIGLCTAALGAGRSAPLAAALLFTLGSLSGIVNVSVMTTLQSSAPSELRGRVLAFTFALAGAAVPLGLALGGLLGDLARPQLARLIVVCGAAIVAMPCLLRFREGAEGR